MNYERLINTEELQEILNRYSIENYEEISSIDFILKNIDMREGEHLLLKHFDFHCKDRIIDFMNGRDSKEEAFLKRKVYKCFELATPRFYESYQQLRKTIRERRENEENFMKECVVFENSRNEILKCMMIKLKNYRKLIDHDVNVYLIELEDFRKNIYL